MATADRYAIQVDVSQALAGINSLKGALGSLAAAFSIREVADFADSLIELKNKLSTLSPALGTVESQFKTLVGVANSARTPLAATADLYFRIARNAQELGLTSAQAASVTETVAKAISASGLSAKEAAGPLLQLGQALQSGRLQGDELRSIMEGLPPVAKALSQSLGVPIGALKELGAAGVISAQDVIRAIQEAKTAIDRDFAGTQITTGQAITVLKNNLAEALSEFDKVTKISSTVADALKSIADSVKSLSKFIQENSEGIRKFVSVAGTILEVVGYFVAAGLALKVFRVAVIAVAEAGGLVAAAWRGIVGLFETLTTQISLMWKNFTGFLTGMKGVGKALEPLSGFAAKFDAVMKAIFGEKIVNNILKVFGALGVGVGALKAAWDSLWGNKDPQEGPKGVQADIRKVDNAIDEAGKKAEYSGKAFRKMFDVDFVKTLTGFKQANEELIRQAKTQEDIIGKTSLQKALIEAQEKAYRPLQGQLSALKKQYDELEQKAKMGGDVDKVRFEAFKKDYPARVAQLNAEYKNTVGALTEIAKATELATQKENLRQFVLKQQADMSEKIQSIQNDMAKLTMTEIEKKYYDIEEAANASARAAIRAEEARRGSPLTQQEVNQYYENARKGVEILKMETLELYENSRTFETGWKQAFNSYVDDATNAAKAAQAIFQKTTQGMEDLIVNFAKTGKFEFKSFINSILEDLLRSQVRQLMAQIFNIGGASKGGSTLLGSVGRLLGFANGGIVPTNSPILVGERGPEIISGAAGRVVTPNSNIGLGTTNVIYNISAVDAMSFKQLVAQDPGFIYAVTQQGAKSIPGTRR